MKKLWFVLLLWWALPACKTQQAGLPNGQTFTLTELEKKQTPSFVKATIQFDTLSKRVSGNDSCNSYSGSYELTGSTLRIGGVAATKKFCTETASWEQEYLAMLAKVNGYAFSQGQLKLMENDKVVAVFK